MQQITGPPAPCAGKGVSHLSSLPIPAGDAPHQPSPAPNLALGLTQQLPWAGLGQEPGEEETSLQMQP